MEKEFPIKIKYNDETCSQMCPFLKAIETLGCVVSYECCLFGEELIGRKDVTYREYIRCHACKNMTYNE